MTPKISTFLVLINFIIRFVQIKNENEVLDSLTQMFRFLASSIANSKLDSIITFDVNDVNTEVEINRTYCKSSTILLFRIILIYLKDEIAVMDRLAGLIQTVSSVRSNLNQ